MAQMFPISAYGASSDDGMRAAAKKAPAPAPAPAPSTPSAGFLPQVMVKVDQLATRVPWWVWFLAGGIALYWLQKRGSLRALLAKVASQGSK